MSLNYIRRFDEIGIGDIRQVGGKNGSLGELVRDLTPLGISVPHGFAVTTDAYLEFIRCNELGRVLEDLLSNLDVANIDDLLARGRRIRQAILAGRFPVELERQILRAYDELLGGHVGLSVAVRSSATAEDLPEASFAGQQETYLNIEGHRPLIDAVRRCYASLFTDRAIAYRAHHRIAHDTVALSVGVQLMVRCDLGCSGVMFTIDTESGFRDVVLINASWGLGESVVQGTVNPDEYCVFKPTLTQGFRPILRKRAGSKETKVVYDIGGGRGTKTMPVEAPRRSELCLSDDEILTLARWACLIEDHYSKLRGTPTPMDIEWGKDGMTGEIFILQARPETVHSQRAPNHIQVYELKERSGLIVSGRSVGEKIATGPARLIRDVAALRTFKDGEILVTDKTDPDWEPIMKRAAAIVTNRGGRTCHAAIVARELGVPAVVGTERATQLVADGQHLTVSCAEGEVGFVYNGRLPFDVTNVEPTSVPRPRTKVMLNVANPEEAMSLSFIPNDGVGLAREEFIVSHLIKVHPMALIGFGEIDDPVVRDQIEHLTCGYSDKAQFFVDRLAEGVGLIAAAFYPKDVIIRLSDFKTNEYANLIGGRKYEPHEENPMIGFRGASRYYDPRYAPAFALECQAVTKVRDRMGLKNLKVMIPFCRTPEEARRVHANLAQNGLIRGKDGLEVYVMCEIPSNVIRAEEFADLFDGFSIGSNDLTQLVLGLDRDNEIVAHIFDERDESVKKMIAHVIRVAHDKGRKVGICGQAPSDYPEFAEFLVRCGIDSISLSPDTVLKTTLNVLEVENKLAKYPTENIERAALVVAG